MIALAVAVALLAAAAEPLACPPGARRAGVAPPEGFAEWCEIPDDAGNGVREGPARTWYDDGALWIEERFHAGKREGRFVEYHRNGKTAREGEYLADAKIGRWTVRGESGNLEEEAEYRAGVPHGRFTSFWAGGVKRTEGRRCGGAQCGVWRTWDPAGKLVGTAEFGGPALAP